MCQKYGVGIIRFTYDPGKVLTSSLNGWDETIRFLDTEKNTYIRYFKGHKSRVSSISLSRNPSCSNDFISTSQDNTIRKWDLRSPLSQALCRDNVPVATLDPLGIVMASVNSDGILKLFDVRYLDSAPFSAFKIHPTEIDWSSIKFSSDGKLLLLSTMSEEVYLVDSFDGRVLHVFSRPNVDASAIEACFDSDSKYTLSGASDGIVRIWENISGTQISQWSCGSEPVNYVNWNPTADLVVCIADTVKIWAPKD